MARGNVPIIAFNRGLISPLSLARSDLKRYQLSAEIQSNWMPRTLGAMMLRPGWEYIGSSNNSNYALWIPFIFNLDDTALIEVTDEIMRFWVNDAPISRASVATAITNGGFDTDLTGWTSADESGAASTSLTGYMVLTGTGFNKAARYQAVSCASGDRGVEHALRVVINRGPVVIRVGTAAGDGTYIDAITLQTGVHSLSFTPLNDFYVQFENAQNYASLVDSVQIESSGVVTIPTPFQTDDLPNIRHDQSADEIFLAIAGQAQQIIQRWSPTAWSLVLYQPQDGPFKVINTGPIELSASAISGDILVTSSESLFRAGHAGALFKITSNGQIVGATLGGADQFSDPIFVTGVSTNNGRQIIIDISGTWSATITIQRSVGQLGDWVDVLTYTGNQHTTYADGFDNQSIYYRIGIKSGQYTSGSASVGLSFAAGGIDGIVQCTAVVSATEIAARVIQNLGSTVASNAWYEGQWSDAQGWPSCVAFHQGRLWWAGNDKIIGSVSDGFLSFDDTNTGDSGPINTSIGSGPVDNVQYLLSLIRLMVGGQMTDFSAMSSTLDEPLTPSNFNLKSPSTQGSAAVQAVQVDYNGIFVQRSGTRLMEMEYDFYTYQYIAQELTVFCPEVGEPGIVRMAVQRKPDTRIHCVRSDGVVAVLIYDKIENVSCFVTVETTGGVEDVVILPGDIEDTVYYSVQRQVNGETVRYLEKWAQEANCRGGTISQLADAHIVYSGTSTATITGLSHLEGETVVAWGDGLDLGTYTVASGQITLSQAVENCVVGLYYQAQYQSTKLAYLAKMGTALTMPKIVDHIGLILAYVHAQGISFGPDFDNLRPLPLVYKGQVIDPTTTYSDFDDVPISFQGQHNTDSRICLVAEAPRSCTVLAAVVEMETDG